METILPQPTLLKKWTDTVAHASQITFLYYALKLCTVFVQKSIFIQKLEASSEGFTPNCSF